MGTQHRSPALAALIACFLPIAFATACVGQGDKAASHSPAATASAAPPATASPSPRPATTPYGVLVGSQGGSSYSVSIVAFDGKLVASGTATAPAQVACGTSAAAIVPLPVSTSDSRLYFMDAAGTVRYLAPGGATGTVTTLPAGTASRRSMFAVSPDDRRIAVVVEDFTSSGATARLYVEDLGGGNRTTTYSQTGTYGLWPTGWRGTTNLIVAKVRACAQGGSPLCCGPLEFHVVDPSSFTRRFTIGGPTCVVAGAPTPAGVVCESLANRSANIENWTESYMMGGLSVPAPTPAHLSPDGQRIAVVVDADTTSVYAIKSVSGPAPLALLACGWIDDTHVMSGGDAQHQPRVADVINGTIVPVPAQGDCGGRIPGGL